MADQDNALLEEVKKLGKLFDDRFTQVDAAVKQGADRNDELAKEFEKVKPAIEKLEKIQTEVRRGNGEADKSPLTDENAAHDKYAKILDTDGWRGLPLTKALSTPHTHEMVKDAPDVDLFKRLQDYHDACVIKHWIFNFKYGATQPEKAREKLLADIDVKTYFKLRERCGFGKAADLAATVKAGKHNSSYSFEDINQVAKANEIHNPEGGAGANLDFTLLSGALIQRMRLDLVVANQFRRLPLTRSSQKLPGLTNDSMGVWGGGSQVMIPPRDALGTGTSPTNVYPPFSSPNFYSALSTMQVQWDVEPLLCFLIWNDYMEEDSIIDWVPLMRDQAAYGAARALDRTLLDGDTAGTHRDTDVTVSNDFRKAIDGFRKMAVNYDIDNSGGTFDIDDFHTMRASLGIYAQNPDRVVCFMALKHWFQLIGNAAASASGDLIRRADTIGADKATLRSGILGQVYGIDCLPSEFIRTDVDATGLRGASGNTKGVIVMANRDRFALGQFNQVRIETTRHAPILTNIIQAHLRVDFQPWDQNALSSGSFQAGLSDVPCNVTFNNA